jgi:excisionase family DNA binding protein
MDKIFTPEELADRWGCCPNTVRNAINEGRLRAFRVGRLLRVPAAAVDEFESNSAIKLSVI